MINTLDSGDENMIITLDSGDENMINTLDSGDEKMINTRLTNITALSFNVRCDLPEVVLITMTVPCCLAEDS